MGAARIARTCLALALAGALAACTGSPRLVPRGPIDSSFEPAFDALRSALEEGDEELAGRVLERILARSPEGATLEHAEVYGRILRGRALSRGLDLWLQAEAGPEGRVRITLVASHGEPQALRFESGPATLRVLSTGLDVAGVEERFATSHPVPALRELHVPAGGEARVEVIEFEPPSGLALGVRTQLDLTLQSGVLVEQGVELPAAFIGVRGCEIQRLAAWLPTQPVEPSELARYVEAGPASLAALIERTVRIPQPRREEALDLLVPILLKRSHMELGALVPSLRWLSSEGDLGADTQAWWDWLEARRDAPRGDSEAESVLDLPTAGADDGLR